MVGLEKITDRLELVKSSHKYSEISVGLPIWQVGFVEYNIETLLNSGLVSSLVFPKGVLQIPMVEIFGDG